MLKRELIWLVQEMTDQQPPQIRIEAEEKRTAGFEKRSVIEFFADPQQFRQTVPFPFRELLGGHTFGLGHHWFTQDAHQIRTSNLLHFQ